MSSSEKRINKKSRNAGKNKNKSIGHILVENQKNFYKFNLEKSKTFNKVIDKLNRTLKQTESLLNINHYPKKILIDNMLPKEKINYLKKVKYLNKWHIYNKISPALPIIKMKENIKGKNKTIEEKKTDGQKTNFHFVGNQLNSIETSDVRNRTALSPVSRGFVRRKKNTSASEIVKMSLRILNKRNRFQNYQHNMQEKLGKFLDYNDIFSDYYDFDKNVKKDIKEERTGLSIPGNALNRIGQIRTIQPKNVKIRIKKQVAIPDRTLLPVPQGFIGKVFNYTHITLNKEYNDQNKMM